MRSACWSDGKESARLASGREEGRRAARCGSYAADMDDHEITSADPFALFQEWMKEAEAGEPNDPNAVALATAGKDGMPSVRMVLMKRASAGEFCFFTNDGSEKGQQLKENPQAAMCFHWKSLRRQVRIEGTVSEMPGQEVDEYFHSRSRRSQLGAAVSTQSRPLKSRELLETQVREFGERYPDQVPRPEYWRGYCLTALRMEFWKDGPDRLHDRFLFSRNDGGWTAQRLYP